jgi:hypothetical protein
MLLACFTQMGFAHSLPNHFYTGLVNTESCAGIRYFSDRIDVGIMKNNAEQLVSESFLSPESSASSESSPAPRSSASPESTPEPRSPLNYHSDQCVASTPITPDDPNQADSCGQFMLVMNQSAHTCDEETGALKNYHGEITQQVYYHGPDNFVDAVLRQGYQNSDGISFSCNICVASERLQFKTMRGIVKSEFSDGETILMDWWDNSTFSDTFSGFSLIISKRLIGVSSAWLPVASYDSPNPLSSFTQMSFNLKDEVNSQRSVNINFDQGYDYEVLIRRQPPQGTLGLTKYYQSTHYFSVIGSECRFLLDDLEKCLPQGFN